MWIFEIFIDLQSSPLSLQQSMRFCLCIVLCSLLTEDLSFAQSSYWLINTYPVFQAFRQWKVPLSTIRFITSCFFFHHSHRFRQRLASVFTTHHSSLTIKTPWEHFQRLLILLVRFIVPYPPTPPHPTPTVSCLANHQAQPQVARQLFDNF